VGSWLYGGIGAGRRAHLSVPAGLSLPASLDIDIGASEASDRVLFPTMIARRPLDHHDLTVVGRVDGVVE